MDNHYVSPGVKYQLANTQRVSFEGEMVKVLKEHLVFLGESGWFSNVIFFFSVILSGGKSIITTLGWIGVTKISLKGVTSLMFEMN